VLAWAHVVYPDSVLQAIGALFRHEVDCRLRRHCRVAPRAVCQFLQAHTVPVQPNLAPAEASDWNYSMIHM